VSRKYIIWVALAAILTASCGGGGITPAAGVFSGNLTVGETNVGTFNFTINNGQIAGTGSLIHNEQTVPVAISGFLNGLTIDAQIVNASLGDGSFDGLFTSEVTCSGTFTYEDIGGVSSQSGTWTAVNAE
jgi:hypothetical protein